MRTTPTAGALPELISVQPIKLRTPERVLATISSCLSNQKGGLFGRPRVSFRALLKLYHTVQEIAVYDP